MFGSEARLTGKGCQTLAFVCRASSLFSFLSLCSKNSIVILSSVLSFYNERQRFAATRRWRFYAPTFIRRTAVQIYTKLSYEARHRHFWVGAVISWPLVYRAYKLQVCQWFHCRYATVFLSVASAFAYFLFSEGKDFFLIQFFLGWER